MSTIQTINLKTTNNTHVERFMGVSYENSWKDESGYSVVSADLYCNGKEVLVISDPDASPAGSGGKIYGGIIYVVPDLGNLASSTKIYGPTQGTIGGSLGVVRNFQDNCDALLIGSEPAFMLFGSPDFADRYVDALSSTEGITLSNFDGAYFADAGYFFGPDKKKAIVISACSVTYGKNYILPGELLTKDIDRNNLSPTEFVEILGPSIEGGENALKCPVTGNINFTKSKYSSVALGYSGWNEDQGMVAVVHGSNSTENINVTIPNTNSRITTIMGADGYQGQVGYALGFAKNFNHDISCDTLFIASPGTGTCFAIWCTDSDIYLDNITPDVGITIQNLSSSDETLCSNIASTAEAGYFAFRGFEDKAHLVSGGSNLKNIDINNGTTYRGLVFEGIDYSLDGGQPIAIAENFEGKNKSSVMIGAANAENSNGKQVGETYLVEDVLSLIPTHPTMHPTHPTMHPTHPTMPTVPTESPTADASNAGSWWLTDGGIATMASVGAFILGMVGLCCYCKFKAHDDATGFTPMND